MRSLDRLDGNETPCLGAHSGSLNKTLVTRTHNLGASGDRAPVTQQPSVSMDEVSTRVSFKFPKVYL